VVAAIGAALAVGSWHAAPPLREPRAAHAVVATRAGIYVLGGSSGTTDVERFDGTRWQVVTHLPHGGLNAPAAVARGGRIWVLGGFEQQTNLPTDRVEIYDPRANRWHDGPPLPAPRGGAAAAILAGTIHLFGGGNSQSTLADHAVYDPRSGRWTSAAPLPRAEGSPAAAVLGGRLYAIGGRSGPDDFGDVFVYDAAHDRWADGPPIPPRGTAGAVAYHGAIYLFGGESQATGSVLGDVFRLTGGATAWRRIAALPAPRNYARSVVFRRAIYVVGGGTAAGASHSAAGSRRVDRFVP
jgi:N-acetylneuraminic acid mutarotase